MTDPPRTHTLSYIDLDGGGWGQSQTVLLAVLAVIVVLWIINPGRRGR